MLHIPKHKLLSLLEHASGSWQVFCPSRQGPTVNFGWFEGMVDPDLIPVNSCKGAFLPQTEELFTYRGTPETGLSLAAGVDEQKPVLVFFARPCDARAFTLLDRVFLEGEYADDRYKNRRARSVVVTVGCKSPLDTCFCTAFGIGPDSKAGSDVFVYDDGTSLYFEPLTEEGAGFVSSHSAYLTEGGTPVSVMEELRRAELPLAGRISVEGMAEALDSMFDDPVWEKMSARCRGCGACTYLCPTCHCFSVFDAPRGVRGKRYRSWDSCQFSDFMLMAGGHNPRPTRKERVRQRFMHKFNYSVKRQGDYLCVGCGRCIRACSVGLHAASALFDLKEAGRCKGC
ncbi:MAG: 4Fe-4S dicluster domain-containing protein [Bacillota bacterium]